MSNKSRIQTRNEPFNGIVCYRAVLPNAGTYSGTQMPSVILGIIEDLEVQPENPVVYLFSFECGYQGTNMKWRDAYGSLRPGHKVRVRSTKVSTEGLPYTADIVVDTSEFAKEFLAKLKKKSRS